ncbi:MAG: hypothetical protein LUC51_02450 [Cloacibacillus porcorum]|nr:hypothetical protein [Cloacibacillus porcorum]
MTRTEMVTKLRTQLCDTQAVGFPDDSELLEYLDRGTIYYSEHMIAARSPDMLRKMAVVGCTELPDDFVALAGQHPVQITGRHMDYYGEVPYQVMYFARLPLPSGYKPDEPVDHPLGADTVIIDLARAFALNRNEYDLSQDLKLVEVWQNAAKGARS